MLALFAVLMSQLPVNACKLLTPADLSGLGGTVTPHNSDSEVSEGPGKSQVVKGCMWNIGEEGMVAISVARAAQGAAREQSLAVLEQTYNQLKAKGWTEEKRDIAGGMCALLTPPPGEKDAPVTTGCIVEARGRAVSVSALGKTKVTIDQVKALLDKVVQRLP